MWGKNIDVIKGLPGTAEHETIKGDTMERQVNGKTIRGQAVCNLVNFQHHVEYHGLKYHSDVEKERYSSWIDIYVDDKLVHTEYKTVRSIELLNKSIYPVVMEFVAKEKMCDKKK